MRIKTNRDQLEGIELLLRKTLEVNEPQNLAERLVYDHINDIYNIVRAKSEAIYNLKNDWSFNINHKQALAFWCWHQFIIIDEIAYAYEVHTLQKIFNTIDQAYAGFKKTNNRAGELASGSSTRRLASPTR